MLITCCKTLDEIKFGACDAFLVSPLNQPYWYRMQKHSTSYGILVQECFCKSCNTTEIDINSLIEHATGNQETVVWLPEKPAFLWNFVPMDVNSYIRATLITSRVCALYRIFAVSFTISCIYWFTCRHYWYLNQFDNFGTYSLVYQQHIINLIHLLLSLIDLTIVPVTPFGCVDPEDIICEVRPSTCLITVMLANNETGILMPVSQIGR